MVIFGAGPDGLTAGNELVTSNRVTNVLEQDSDKIGLMTQTVEYKGFQFDIGGHRFFSKSRHLEELWTGILRDE